MAWKKVLAITGILVLAAFAVRQATDFIEPRRVSSEAVNHIQLSQQDSGLHSQLQYQYDLDKSESVDSIQSDGVEVQADGGQTVLKVTENLTTGYRWNIDQSDCNESVISIETSHEAAATEVGGDFKAGAPGILYVTLTGQGRQGSCKVRMAYARPWEFDWKDKVSNNAQLIEFEARAK